MNQYHIAFVGNPNVGKSGWVNKLGNSDFHIGNWPGVTVQKMEAKIIWNHAEYHLIDLPGCYSLSENSNEGNITASFLKNTDIDLIINVIDATNLYRNLLLTLYLRELQIPMMILLNFMDEAKKQQIDIDVQTLSKILQITIIPCFLHQKDVGGIQETIGKETKRKIRYSPVAFKADSIGDDKLHRYEVIQSIVDICCKKSERKTTIDEKIDAVVLHPFFGIPIFLLLFVTLLYLVFQISAPITDYFDYILHDIIEVYIDYFLSSASSTLRHFVIHAIVKGIGGILVFIPLMSVLSFMSACIEESGYMARIIFLFDHLMNQFHLNGKSFVLLILGLGCHVPALYATRTIDSEKQKKLTALLIPFMSCGARLPVYALFAQAFFKEKAWLMIILMYAISFLAAFLLVFVYALFFPDEKETIWILEMPRYRLPSFPILLKRTVLEVKAYTQKVFKIVIWIMILLWMLLYFPNGTMESSYLASGAKAITPVFEPLGFGNRWECIAALPASIMAKETIIGFLQQSLIEDGEEIIMEIDAAGDLKEVIHRGSIAILNTAMIWHPIKAPEANKQTIATIAALWDDQKSSLRAFCFMVYVSLCMPCIMMLHALYQEYGGYMLLLSMISMLIIPYVVVFFIFQTLSFFM